MAMRILLDQQRSDMLITWIWPINLADHMTVSLAKPDCSASSDIFGLSR